MHHATFALPVASHGLFLLSRGSHQHGDLRVTQGPSDDALVRVDVRVAYRHPRALERLSLCRLQDGDRDGVGIYTPAAGGEDDRLDVQVVFAFPRTAHDPLCVKSFATHAPHFAHDLGDLWQSIRFEHLDVHTANAPIRADAITLDRGSLSSSNGPIVGHFNVSDALVLRTSNAPIQTTASLWSSGRDPTRLEMHTSNSAITSSISLATPSGTGGHFAVTSRSSNGPIRLQYDDAPLCARLASDARTSNDRVSVALHPAFEGRFEASTSNARAVVRDSHPPDPSGRGRRRIVTQRTSRSSVAGTIEWAGVRGGDSVCTAHTSNGAVSLEL